MKISKTSLQQWSGDEGARMCGSDDPGRGAVLKLGVS